MTAATEQITLGGNDFVHRAAVFCMTCRHYRDAPCSRHCWSDDRASWEDER